MNDKSYLRDGRYKRVRIACLNRDKHLCQRHKRFGKKVEANIAHHIWPVEFYPQYKFSLWNLIALCNECHNQMHKRDSHELTAEGERLKSKTPPP